MSHLDPQPSEPAFAAPPGALGDNAFLAPLEATLVEPGRELAPARVPGPGILAALAWSLLLIVLQSVPIVLITIPATILNISKQDLILAIFPVATTTLLLLAVGLVVALTGWNAPRVLALRMPHALHVLLIVLLVLPVWLLGGEIAAWASDWISPLNDDMFKDVAKAPFWFVLLIGAVMPAVGEEIYFRGFVGRGLIARYGPWAGCLLSGVIFGVFHIDPPQAIGVVLLGVAAQGTMLATRSLFVPMLLHGLNNTASFALLKYAETATAGVEHLPLGVVVAAAAALAALAVVFYHTRSRWIAPDGSDWSPGYVTAESPPPQALAEFRRHGCPARWWVLALVVYGALVGTVAWEVWTMPS